jgi:hypothetical protein
MSTTSSCTSHLESQSISLQRSTQADFSGMLLQRYWNISFDARFELERLNDALIGWNLDAASGSSNEGQQSRQTELSRVLRLRISKESLGMEEILSTCTLGCIPASSHRAPVAPEFSRMLSVDSRVLTISYSTHRSDGHLIGF